MAFSISMEKAARRHFLAGEYLFNNTDRQDVAGYLYGLAAECAIKEMLSRTGIGLGSLDRRDNPIFAHFPELKRLLRNHIKGRNAQVLQQFLQDRYMQEWDITMRYAPANDIKSAMVSLWRENAKQAINAMSGFFGRHK